MLNGLPPLPSFGGATSSTGAAPPSSTPNPFAGEGARAWAIALIGAFVAAALYVKGGKLGALFALIVVLGMLLAASKHGYLQTKS